MPTRDPAASAPNPSDPRSAAAPVPAPPPDPEIRAERAHLAESREALRLMYEDVVTTETPAVYGDWVSTQVLRQAREMRAEALQDIPDVPLFFGRLDFDPGTVFEADPESGPIQETAAGGRDRVHIGRRHVHDRQGRALVLDWRAPVSTAFYQAGPQHRMGVQTRRRYGFDTRAELTAYEDEDLVAPAAAPTTSTILTTEIERPRSGPMRDIVATIQPEQDDLVRAALDTTICVQGAPGTGKTAVGLHRIAYLLYTQRQRLHRTGVAIIGPNRSFLGYIRNVLPALGEINVSQTTINDLIDHAPIRHGDTPEAARVKGDVRMAEVVHRDLWDHLRPPADTVVLQRGSRRWRVHPEDLAELQRELKERGVSYGSGRDMLAHRIAHTVLSLMEAAGEVCDDRTHDQIRRTREVKAAVTAMWPAVDPAKLVVGLLTDPDRLARAADGLLSAEEQAAIMLPGKPRSPKSARFSAADLALIDEAAHQIERRSGMGHIVIDEAQDLTPMQCRAIGRRCAGSMTVLGDLAQATTPAAPADWPTLLAHLDQPKAHLAVLERGYRVPAQIIDYAARLLPAIAPELGTPSALRQAPGSLRVTPAGSGADLAADVAAACAEALTGPGSVGLIAADTDIEDLHRAMAGHGLAAGLLGRDDGAMEADRLVCVPASLAKGLEFDSVVVAEPARIAAAEPRGLQRLYVVLTRAVSTLHVVHAEPLPGPLG